MSPLLDRKSPDGAVFVIAGSSPLVGNPYWGRFLSPDPTWQERNLYAYAESDPVNRVDPTGGNFLDLGCYISRAWADTDNSWSDEAEDLNACFNPFADWFVDE